MEPRGNVVWWREFFLQPKPIQLQFSSSVQLHPTKINEDENVSSEAGSCGILCMPSAEKTPPTATANYADKDDECENGSYDYHLKIINPKKKSDYLVRMWHGVSGMFKSPLTLRVQIHESFPDDVPSTSDFQVGYLEGNTKRWIVEKRDLIAMYSTFPSPSKITLWCDAKVSEPPVEPVKED